MWKKWYKSISKRKLPQRLRNWVRNEKWKGFFEHYTSPQKAPFNHVLVSLLTPEAHAGWLACARFRLYGAYISTPVMKWMTIFTPPVTTCNVPLPWKLYSLNTHFIVDTLLGTYIISSFRPSHDSVRKVQSYSHFIDEETEAYLSELPKATQVIIWRTEI